jgi:hypothetical protein
MPRDDWIGEPCRPIERKPFSRAGKNFRREEDDRGARGCPSYHLGHLCAAPQAETDIPVVAVQTLIDLFAEVVRFAIQQRSGNLRLSRRRTRQSQPCVDRVFSCARDVQQEETAHEADVLVEVHHVQEAVGARHRPITMTN